jgi:hypothetical protein
MRPGRGARVAIVFAVLIGVGWGSAKSLHSPGPEASSGSSEATTPACRSNALAGVHDPSRLKILKACATFVGTVVQAPRLNRGDGDVYFDAKPDKGYESMLNAHNWSSDHGLHLEIVPMDQPGCKPGQPIVRKGYKNLGVCTGANVVFPPLKAHVRVTGAFVFDSWSGPNEIHPIWRVEILKPAGPQAPEAIKLKARLTGRALRGAGSVAVRVTPSKVCWRFRGLGRLRSPTSATIRAGTRRRTGPVVLQLGGRYRPRGCVTAKLSDLDLLEAHPDWFYVAVATARHPLAAVRGKLKHNGD